jgi:inner membrane protein
MDPVTHGLAGYVVAKTGLTRDTGRWGVVAGVIASLFPDVDSFLGPFVGTEFTLKYHRGLTNSVFLAVPFSLFFAWLFVKVSGKRRFWAFFLIWLVEILAHTFLDLLTSYGTMILSPFSVWRFALDWVFIIDLFMTGGLLVGAVAIWIWRGKDRTLARVCVALVVSYMALCAYNHFWALSLAKTFARSKGSTARNIAALPQPLSPFHWGNYIVTGDKIYEGFVNLIGKHERTASQDGNLFRTVWARYQPIRQISYRLQDQFDDSPWVRRALTLEGIKTFSWFARFPMARYKGASDGRHRVTFFDLRFGGIEGRMPFVYEVVFDAKGEVLFQGFDRAYFLDD